MFKERHRVQWRGKARDSRKTASDVENIKTVQREGNFDRIDFLSIGQKNVYSVRPPLGYPTASLKAKRTGYTIYVGGIMDPHPGEVN